MPWLVVLGLPPPEPRPPASPERALPRSRPLAPAVELLVGMDVLLAGKAGTLVLLPLDPRPPTVKDAPTPAVAPIPRPREGSKPKLMPDEPMLSPAPSDRPTDTDAPSVADNPRSRIVLEDDSFNPTPAPTPKDGLGVIDATMQPLSILPPLSQVLVAPLVTPDALSVFVAGTPTPERLNELVNRLSSVPVVEAVRPVLVGAPTPTPTPTLVLIE